MAAQLSININKYALLRNSRGHDHPNLCWAADLVLASGAHGITVHPRADQRHIRFADVPAIAAHLRAKHPGVELNIECEPAPHILDLVWEHRPAQCTLVPVKPGEITSDHGWDLPARGPELAAALKNCADLGIRSSIFMQVDAPDDAWRSAADLGVGRVELYTGPYAWAWGTPGQAAATAALWRAAERAAHFGLGVNAGHDLDRHNLVGLQGLACLDEVSIGHAMVVRALEVGTRQSVQELLVGLGE